MTIVESTSSRLVISAGSGINKTTLTLDKAKSLARLERSLMLWKRKPVEIAFSEIKSVAVMSHKDNASGVVVHQPVLHLRDGSAVALTVADGQAENTARQLRGFLGLGAG